MTYQGRLATLIAVLALSFGTYQYQQHPAQPEFTDISHIVPLDEPEVLPEPIMDAEDFLVQLDQAEFECMRTNMYFEARNQKSDDAYVAVGYTVLNRVKSKRYPDSICGVVWQARRDANGQPIRHKCQFSRYCDGKPDIPNLANVLERRAWERAGEIAAMVMRNEVDNPVGDAIMYHAKYVNPHWKSAYKPVAIIETHIFYSKA